MNLENHQNPDQNPDCEGETRSTGPRTPEGKAISSQNATKHGCRLKTLILRDEDPTEYEALHQKWSNQYQPIGQAEETLVKQVIDNHWYLMRAQKRMEQVDFGLAADVLSWTADQQKLFNNFQRYKTAAERAFQKSFREVEAYLRDRRRDKIAAEKAELMRAKIEAQIKKLAPKPEPPPASSPRSRRLEPESEAIKPSPMSHRRFAKTRMDRHPISLAASDMPTARIGLVKLMS